MATPIKDRIVAAAIATPALTALLGINPFRWYDRQLVQGSAFPAVVAREISAPRVYALAGPLPTAFRRWQFTLWGTNNSAGIASLASLESALDTFWESLNLVGIPGMLGYNNQVVNRLDAFYPIPEPGNPQRLIDVMIFANDNL